ncbi:MAG TPA: hypothetical protein VFT60_11665 [Bryobacteraceae bacterium]|jgi:hypothetical protein|nr:hypothetical protein [Bryobacteraceae bacterium]
MACPLFIPSSPLGDPATAAAPLGDMYAGQCAASPDAEIEPDTLRRFCNLGYARRRCERAAQAEADAVRVLVRADDGRQVQVAWSIERDHHPVAVGVESVEVVAGEATSSGNLTALAAQVRACASSYARQTLARPALPRRNAVAAHP